MKYERPRYYISKRFDGEDYFQVSHVRWRQPLATTLIPRCSPVEASTATSALNAAFYPMFARDDLNERLILDMQTPGVWYQRMGKTGWVMLAEPGVWLVGADHLGKSCITLDQVVRELGCL